MLPVNISRAELVSISTQERGKQDKQDMSSVTYMTTLR